MNTRFFLFLTFALVWIAACQNDKVGSKPIVNDGKPPSQSNKCGDGRLGSPREPSQSVETSMLLQNYWVFEFCIIANDPPRGRAKEGSWYKFNPDGTFTSGYWEQEICHGNWYVSFPIEGKPVLLLDSANDTEDSEFEIQGYSQDGMSWVGTKKFSQTDMMIKAINLLTKPTKAQFGRQ